ncbi:hypothetical protein PV08_06123 [Exophiala spinifera]|uniref:Acyltransferase 3 domain-containing protein n=1 Tax=Exophiala spinifera TaxID=91928 RepID=A0A0D1ZTH5_9EURO|nr:uncharacterized protein PV08_06123 [Exophiala spinifera]KIW16072.1 hypothetical protein PV08_06123 [Exophiala spinifera]
MAEKQHQQSQHTGLDVDHEAHYSETAAPLSSLSTGQVQDLSSTVDKVPVWYGLSQVRCYARFNALSSFKRLMYALIPSFITTSSATTPSKSGISALDGLRGIACLFVFGEHYVICYQSRDTQVWIMRVPFIRLIYYGKAAVFLFFVISGYVLSVKPLKLIRSKSYLEFQKTISSSFLRRAIRLYLPCLIASFIACNLTSLGFFDDASIVYKQLSDFIFLKERPPPHVTLASQWRGYLSNAEFIFSGTIPYDKDTNVLNYLSYDDHQWTIPKEFQSSMAVFALLVTTSRVRTFFRMVIIFSLAVYAGWTFRLYTALFFAGMLCAETDLIRAAYYADHAHHGGSRSGLHRLMHLPNAWYKCMWVSFFTVGVWMISSPQEIQQTPNYLPSLLAHWGVWYVDDKLLTFGSILVVWSVATCPSLGPLFNNPFVAYLGKISYALYLVHGTVIKSLGYTILPRTLRLATGAAADVELNAEWWATVSDSSKVTAYLLGLSCVGTVCFWMSDLFWRFVDIPCVNFARAVENCLTRGADSNEVPLLPRSNPRTLSTSGGQCAGRTNVSRERGSSTADLHSPNAVSPTTGNAMATMGVQNPKRKNG